MKATVKSTEKSKVNRNESNYFVKVINVNKALKQELNSVGACRSMLLENSEAIQLDKAFKTLLQNSKKDESIYKNIDTNVRRSKSGKVSPFGVLQALYKLTKEVKK
jgi:hypothetical protein